MSQAVFGIGVVLFFQRLLFDFQLRGAAFELIDFSGHGIDLDAQRGGGLVDQVDRFVGQKAVGNVAMRKSRCGNNGRVLDADAVMHFVLFLQPAEDGDGVFDIRLAHEHDLKAAFERGVFFDVLAIFIERGSADGAQLSAGKRGFQHIRGVDRAFGGAGADQGVQLVDEEDDLALRIFDFFQDGFQAVFEFAAILRAREHGSQIERDDALVLQDFGHVAGDDALRQAFDNGRLAHSRLADEHGIIFRTPRKHLHHAADFFIASDDGIELAAPCLLVQVAGITLQRLILRFGILVGDALRSSNRGERFQDGVVGRAVTRHQLLSRIALESG